MIYYLPVEGISTQPLTGTGCSDSHSPFAKVRLMRPDALKFIYRIEKKYRLHTSQVGDMYPKAEHEKESLWK